MRMMSSMPSIPTIGEQYANAASYAREKGVAVDGDQETFGQRLTEVCLRSPAAPCDAATQLEASPPRAVLYAPRHLTFA